MLVLDTDLCRFDVLSMREFPYGRWICWRARGPVSPRGVTCGVAKNVIWDYSDHNKDEHSNPRHLRKAVLTFRRFAGSRTGRNKSRPKIAPKLGHPGLCFAPLCPRWPGGAGTGPRRPLLMREGRQRLWPAVGGCVSRPGFRKMVYFFLYKSEFKTLT